MVFVWFCLRVRVNGWGLMLGWLVAVAVAVVESVCGCGCGDLIVQWAWVYARMDVAAVAFVVIFVSCNRCEVTKGMNECGFNGGVSDCEAELLSFLRA